MCHAWRCGLLQRILGNHGVDIMTAQAPGETQSTPRCTSRPPTSSNTVAPYELVSRMRASFWWWPLRAHGRGEGVDAGGCAIARGGGSLIMALERSATAIEIDRRLVIARAKHGLKGGEIKFPKVHRRRYPHRADGRVCSRMAPRDRERRRATRDQGRRPIAQQDGRQDQARRDFADRGSRRAKLRRAPRVLPDRIETGTYAMAVAMTGAT